MRDKEKFLANIAYLIILASSTFAPQCSDILKTLSETRAFNKFSEKDIVMEV